MTYRSLLVFLDRSPSCAVRTQVAMRLAAELDSHLVGLAPTGLVNLPASTAVAAGVGDFAERLGLNLREEADRAAAQFDEQCRAAGVKSFETLVDHADKARSVIRHAHCSDLTVLSQADPESEDHALELGLLEQVVLHSARPTLIVPYTGRQDAVGTNVMVAWDDSREAARALADALPLLRLAKRVQVINWSEHGAIDDTKQRARLGALKQWLTYHGVEAEAHVENKTGIGIADAILSRSADFGADLIVMGAYGRTRLAERVFGGATRGLLASMTAPVLMSH